MEEKMNCIEDKNLTMQELWVLQFISSSPEHRASVKTLADATKEGKTTVYNVVGCLVRLGYLEKERVRGTDGKVVEIAYKIPKKAQLKFRNNHYGNSEKTTMVNSETAKENVPPTPPSKEKTNNIYLPYIVPPTLEEAKKFAEEQGLKTNVEAFVTYSNATGWMIGKTPIVDWKEALKYWASKDKPTGKGEATDGTPTMPIMNFGKGKPTPKNANNDLFDKAVAKTIMEYQKGLAKESN